jgi:predicted permease
VRALLRLGRLWRTLTQGRALDRELDAELAHYVDVQTQRNLERGMTADVARRSALVEIGGVEQVKESAREVRAGATLDTLIRDLRSGGRLIARGPGFAAVVVLTLALGIGANVTMFSVMYSVLWRPLPYPDASRLVLLGANVKQTTGAGLASGEALDLRQQTQTLEGVAAVSGVDANLTIDGELERVYAVSANDDALRLLGADPPALGRTLRASSDLGKDGFVATVVISDGLWRRRFGTDPATVGRHIQVNNIDVEIVGVLAPGLRVFLPTASNAAEQVDVWFPRPMSSDRNTREPATLARLKPGVTLAQAQAELDTISSRFVQAYPSSYPDGDFRMTASPLQDVLTARVKPALIALGIAVAFVLLIACVNVTNLMLARARARERELAVRRALGAGRIRMVRQLLTESALLAGLGSVAGLIAGSFGVQLLDWMRPTHLPRQSQISVDSTVAVYTIAISVIVCLVFGVVPALRVTRREDLGALNTGRSGGVGLGIQRLQRTLVIAEVALSIIPLVAGGLMLRSFWNLTSAPIGFDPRGLVSAKVAFSFRAFPDTDRKWQLNQTAIERVRQLPRVEAVSAASPLPFAPYQWTRRYRRAGVDGEGVLATQQIVMPGYLPLTHTRLLEGRDLTADDVTHARKVAVIDEQLARRLWPEGGALGGQTVFTAADRVEKFDVVGVTNPVRAVRVQDADVAHVFLPYHVSPGQLSLVIRTSQSAAALGPSIRKAVESLGTLRPVTEIRPMSDYVADSLGETRFTMLMLVGFAAASLLLAAIGLYGTLAYLISQRTQEFGVRMALGASLRSVVSLVVREGATLTLIGASVGFVCALGLAGGLRGLLYGVAPIDPTTIIGVVALLAAVAIVAVIQPAWRAASVDPTTALRAD